MDLLWLVALPVLRQAPRNEMGSCLVMAHAYRFKPGPWSLGIWAYPCEYAAQAH
jgi:hypothetical protein